MSSAWIDELLALQTAVDKESPSHQPAEGIVASGSWDATNATIQFVDGATAAISPDEDGDQPLVVDEYPVATTALGDQYGPVGNERAHLIPTESGHIVLYEHGADDSPKAPSGERHIMHRNASGAFDAHLKLTNDGPTTGDGLGGTHVGGNGGLTTITTKSGHTITMNDTAQTVVVTSAGGHTVSMDDINKTLTVQSAGGLQHLFNDNDERITQLAGSAETIIDGANNQISHVAHAIGVGDVPANLSSINAAMRNTDLSTFESSLKTMRLNDLSNVATAVATALATASPPVTISASSIIALIASLAHISVPSGSAITLIK